MATEIKAVAALNNCATLAMRVGCRQDQLTRFLNAGYVPQPRQLEFHAAARLCDLPDGPDRIGYAGTRGQAKSHGVLAQAVVDDMGRFDGLKFLYLRKIQKKAHESFEDLRRHVLTGFPHSVKNDTLYLPNGSFMVMGGFRTEADVDSYLGLEYDGAVIEDATTLTLNKRNAVRGSIRTARGDGWRPRIYESANPGGVGHAWYKKEYWNPWLLKEEHGTRFIHTVYGDNVFINKEYGAYLDGLTGWLRRAWRDGDFEISAGQFFSPWSEAIHVVDRLKRLPRHWRCWLAMDYGFSHWNVVYLIAQNSDGVLYFVDEHAERRWLVPRHANAVRAMLERWEVVRYETFVSGADVFAQRGDDAGSIAEQWAKQGFKLTPADDDRINGAAEMLARLGDAEYGIRPMLFVTRACPRLIENIPALEHDPNRPEDVLKTDTDDDGQGGDDFYDAARYGVMVAAKKQYPKPESRNA